MVYPSFITTPFTYVTTYRHSNVSLLQTILQKLKVDLTGNEKNLLFGMIKVHSQANGST